MSQKVKSIAQTVHDSVKNGLTIHYDLLEILLNNIRPEKSEDFELGQTIYTFIDDSQLVLSEDFINYYDDQTSQLFYKSI